MYEQYPKIRQRLNEDYHGFENRVAKIIGKYGRDYNEFVEKYVWAEIGYFTRRWRSRDKYSC